LTNSPILSVNNTKIALSEFEVSEARARGDRSFQTTLPLCLENDEKTMAEIKALQPATKAPLEIVDVKTTATGATVTSVEVKGASPKKGKHGRNQSNGRGSQTVAAPVAEPVKVVPSFPTAPSTVPSIIPSPLPVPVMTDEPIAIQDDFLYIGDMKQGTDLALCRRFGITDTVATIGEDESNHEWGPDDDIIGTRVPLPNGPGDLSTLFEKTIAFISTLLHISSFARSTSIYALTNPIVWLYYRSSEGRSQNIETCIGIL
jgi:hypothetical protein